AAAASCCPAVRHGRVLVGPGPRVPSGSIGTRAVGTNMAIGVTEPHRPESTTPPGTPRPASRKHSEHSGRQGRPPRPCRDRHAHLYLPPPARQRRSVTDGTDDPAGTGVTRTALPVGWARRAGWRTVAVPPPFPAAVRALRDRTCRGP